jgi:hypothetical protein
MIWTYDYPDVLVDTSSLGKNIRSDVYNVKIIQGNQSYDSYVLADFNTFPDANYSLMTPWNHSTCFSFTGTVQIVITKKFRSEIKSCKVYPLNHEIQYNF